jgi:MarR family transcriptional regulator, organic hydroperoxide resistance regulator
MIVHVKQSIDTPAVYGTDAERRDRIIADFGAAIAELRCIGSERLVRAGVSMTQLHVLSMLARHGEMPMSRLAESIDVSLSNVTGLIDRIEERGYVERVRVPDDRRVVLVRVTDAGRSVLDETEALRSEMLRQILDRLPPERLDGLTEAMADLRSAVEIFAGTPGISGHDHATHPDRPSPRRT